MFDWKWVELPCPSCGFPHQFKRTCALTSVCYVGHYSSDDARSRKDCKQEMIFGEGTYDQFCELTFKEEK
jgi:hypothetical protein